MIVEPSAIPPIIVVSHINDLTRITYHDPEASIEDLMIDVDVSSLPEYAKKDLRETILRTFDQKKWRIYTVLFDLYYLFYRKHMNNLLLVEFGSRRLVYEMDLESKPIIVNMLKKYRKKL